MDVRYRVQALQVHQFLVTRRALLFGHCRHAKTLLLEGVLERYNIAPEMCAPMPEETTALTCIEIVRLSALYARSTARPTA